VPWVLLSSEADDAAGRTLPAAGAAAQPTGGAVVDEQLGGGAGATAPPSPAAPSSPAKAARKKTTPAAMVALIARLLPDRKLSHLRHLGDDLHVQVYLDSGDGPGMMAVSIADSDRKPSQQSGPEIAVDRLDGNCVQTIVASALWPDGTLVQAEVATCLAWDGTENKPADAPLTEREAAGLVADKRWGLTMSTDLIEAGAEEYADQIH